MSTIFRIAFLAVLCFFSVAFADHVARLSNPAPTYVQPTKQQDPVAAAVSSRFVPLPANQRNVAKFFYHAAQAAPVHHVVHAAPVAYAVPASPVVHAAPVVHNPVVADPGANIDSYGAPQAEPIKFETLFSNDFGSRDSYSAPQGPVIEVAAPAEA